MTAMVLMAGCGGGGEGSPPDPAVGEAMNVEVIDTSSFSALEPGEARNLVFTNQADWTSLWARHKAGTADAPPAATVDFTRENVVALIQDFGHCRHWIVRGVGVERPSAGPGTRVVAQVRYNSTIGFCFSGPYQPVTVARVANPWQLQVEFKELPTTELKR